MQRLLQRLEHLDADAQPFGEGRRADRHDHEFLEVDRVVGMHAAVDDVHHRHRQHAGLGAADIAVERQLVGDRRGLGDRQRHAEDGVGAEPRLVGRAVERDHRLVDLALRLGVHAADGIENLAFDGGDRLLHALAEIAFLVAVAQFDRLMRAGRGAGWHRGAAARAVLEHDLDLDGRVAAAVEHFAADDVGDGGHGVPGLWRLRRFYRRGAALVMPRGRRGRVTDHMAKKTAPARPHRAAPRLARGRRSSTACRTRIRTPIMSRASPRRSSPRSARSPASRTSRIS